ncbi:hypothetical protein SAMN04487950_3810 [Halogranum rubrum]|uniref:Uncharacterized protein n=1 Tax=Halogranum rubrum TaxID=553466 RepID=A0A1I4HSX2_9EURY|nr:hypothetical protein [Halogranum rubrum]SFL45114.1 hypothetical protein SAMN04487950_3810 [Halogranum rubrum]
MLEGDPESQMNKWVNELPNPLDDAFLMEPNQSGKEYDVSLVNTTHTFHEDNEMMRPMRVGSRSR